MSDPAAGPDTILAALRQLGDGPADEEVSVGTMVRRLDARAQSLSLFLLAAPNLTPGPSIPGFSTIFGLPLCIVAFEMMLGRPHLRLPGFLARRTFRRSQVAAFIDRITPLLLRFERLLKPRWPRFAASSRQIGAACFLLGILLTLPIPIFSLLPATVVLIIALGRLARDGLVVAIGLALGLVTAVAFAALVWLGYEAVT